MPQFQRSGANVKKGLKWGYIRGSLEVIEVKQVMRILATYVIGIRETKEASKRTSGILLLQLAGFSIQWNGKGPDACPDLKGIETAQL